MSGTVDKLVRMANQIAEEFEHQQGGNAARATWDHIWHFWDPGMRALIVAYLDAGGVGLRPTAREAVALLRGPADPSPQPRATEADGDRAGNSQADAG
jgi:formate dehydrogenase subunit delta